MPSSPGLRRILAIGPVSKTRSGPRYGATANRAEYNNTIRDLLGVDVRPADNFPQDDSGYGFDNIGDVLSLSPVTHRRSTLPQQKESPELLCSGRSS